MWLAKMAEDAENGVGTSSQIIFIAQPGPIVTGPIPSQQIFK
jgi:hypothetical protein